MKIGSGLRDSITGPYAFVGNDKVAGVNLFDTGKPTILSFPEGRVVEKVEDAVPGNGGGEQSRKQPQCAGPMG